MYFQSKLLRPLDYLRIKHPQKFKFDYTIPAILAIISTILFLILPLPINLFKHDGLIQIISNLLPILSGFYIASLAAVATFDKPGMDQKLAGRPIKLMVYFKGKFTEEELTRRRFLCLLFGYLAYLGIFIYFVGSVGNLLSDNIKYLLPTCFYLPLKVMFMLIYLFLVFNLLTTTAHGLYYLIDRIHKADPVRIEE